MYITQYITLCIPAECVYCYVDFSPIFLYIFVLFLCTFICNIMILCERLDFKLFNENTSWNNFDQSGVLAGDHMTCCDQLKLE